MMTKDDDKSQPNQSPWQSDAEKLNLPVTNLHDTGAPLLDRDEVIRKSTPTYEEKK